MSVKNLKKELENLVPENVLKTLYLCSQAAEKMSLQVFLIGGAVRDIVICEAGVKKLKDGFAGLEALNSFFGKNHFDTDITVQGNAVEFAYHLADTYPESCKIKEIHESFGTVKIIFAIENEEIALDIASTRKESYPYPGSLPFVEEIGCELYEDVKRRDFSINSMALSLDKETFGDLIDYLGGYDDIKRKKIRVLHDKSFIDDPTRIIRALKFRVRFNYELDETTKYLQDKCLESGMFDNICGERIKSELKQTFNLNKAECLEIFLHEHIYKLVNKDIKISESLSKACEKTISEYFKHINPDFVWLIYLGILLSDFSKEKISQIAEKLYLSNPETEVLIGAKELLSKPEIKENSTNFEVYEFFEEFMCESILVLLIEKSDLKNQAELYLEELKTIKIDTTGQTLIDLGLNPGPVFGEILRKLLKARINGEFSSGEGEKEFLQKLVFDL